MPAKEKYKLQRLLEMRERARDDAALFLAECNREVAAAEKELQRRIQAVEDCKLEQIKNQNEMIEKAMDGMKSTEAVRYRRHSIYLREKGVELKKSVEDQKHVVTRAEQKADKALEALNEAAKEAKVIEKHRENWKVEKKIEGERREQKLNDEIGAILHERQKLDL